MRVPVLRAPVCAVLLLVSCGPVQSSTLIVDAQAELAAAQTAGGDRAAPFEYTAAEEYLHKAREEQSYADFEVSVTFAKKSRECARKARMIGERTTRSGMGVADTAAEKKMRCRPGPEREGMAQDPSEEPAAQQPVAEPADPKPAAPKKAAQATPPKTQRPVAPIKPKEEGEPADPPPEQQAPAKKQPPKTPPAAKKKVEEPLPEGDDDTPPVDPKKGSK